MPERPLWRRTPPAVFFVCLGLFGLGLGWRSAAEVLPVPHEIGDLLLGFALAFYLYFLVFYLRKMVARPSVLFDDLSSPPARAAMSAAAMSMMLFAAALLPFGVSVPQVWWTGVVLQVGASAVACWVIWREPQEDRSFTPFQFLTFVGPVVGPIAGIPLGYVTESALLTLAALVPFCVITIGFALQALREPPTLKMRPTLAIFLAPTGLFAISFGLLQVTWAFTAFYGVATLTALVLLTRARWMAAGGWSPQWAAFTFPSTVFVNLQVLAVARGFGLPAELGVGLGLAVSTPVVLFVTYRFVGLWVTGELAAQTGAARA
ncbi:hypothetical protein [Aliiroseovarius subalbicans]|uniref:SLAC1 family transporter n=1 Tax=Aliiroseovarius subalbicans TaxID=2925840 RepID=UPI001F583086|nr:hypothetical protein [uncultured Aliiroseovarius sp.]MCI2398391.1 hypothetical protein [Aliiroseovarius subalbicans]